MASSQNVKSGTEQQVELWIELKEQVDLVYKQLNQYRGACRSVDRLNRAVRRTGGQLDPDKMLKFERDYRVSKKRLRKLDRQLLAVNLYDKLYDLYESLVMGESIGTGGDLIDSSAIVDGCNGPVGIEDNSGNDIADSERHFQCSKCDKSFKTSVLCNHKRSHKSEPRFKCSWEGCDYGTNYSQSLKAHQAIHTGERPFHCPQCDKSFKTSSHLYHHKRTHESEPRFKCNWEGCDYGTNYSQSLKGHQAIHTRERSFQCSKCDKSFKTSSDLRKHKRIHESEPRFKCSWEGCDYGTYYSHSLKAHQTVHTGKHRFNCCWEGCDYGSNHLVNLTKHQTVHSDERPFQCPQCDKLFKTSSNLSSHMWTHESEPRFKCKWEGCDYGTNFNEHFKAHQTVHTGKHRFKCSWEGCDYGTYYSQAFKVHQAIHTRERPFQCPQCDKSFKTTSALCLHKRTHESELRYKCSWEGCDFGSHQLVNLTRHQNLHMTNQN